MKKTLLLSVFLSALMLITTQIAYGGGNPLPPLTDGSEYGNCIGPEVTGTFIVQSVGDGSAIMLEFNGMCKNYPVTFSGGPLPLAFESLTPEYLLGDCGGCTSSLTCTGPQELNFFIDEQCYPNNKYVNLYPVVYKVIQYIVSGDTKTIKIVGRWPVIISPK